jgi:hypothetical protein
MIISNTVSSSYYCLHANSSHPNSLRHSGFLTKHLYVFVITFVFVNCSIYLSLLNLALIVYDEVPIVKFLITLIYQSFSYA